MTATANRRNGVDSGGIDGLSGTAASGRPVTPVGIVAAKLARVTRRLASTPGIDPAMLAELAEARDLAAGLDDYLEECTTPESPDLARLARRTRNEDWSTAAGAVPLEQEMLSGHVEGQFLKLLVQLIRARRVLEIGMFTGYSALAMAEALPADGVVVACELDTGVAGFARQSFAESAAGHKIDVRVGPGLATLEQLDESAEQFELVFIDADKAGYAGYVDAVLRYDLLAPGGLICVDNTLMQGQPYLAGPSSPNGAAIEAFNRAISADPRIEQVLLPLRDGITLIRPVD